ncbi:hypothetical protein KIN20_013793 [Parelaphostrongylus tenuis]|uniref:Uncharacterized protein n=1 Tax=Parelaphostrongylus tenuis TaxID=148309 RepID=A0AAD5MG40_PARTN|nr:hypothetical protein KIN20_013793 [Parelaphostrongylus tenuis]
MFSEGNFEYMVPTTEEPALLIGVDYFWDNFLFDDFYCEQLPHGHRILHTSVGNIVTGNAPQKEELTFTSIQSETPLIQHNIVHFRMQLETFGNWKPSATWTIPQAKIMNSAYNSSIQQAITTVHAKGTSFNFRSKIRFPFYLTTRN